MSVRKLANEVKNSLRYFATDYTILPLGKNHESV